MDSSASRGRRRSRSSSRGVSSFVDWIQTTTAAFQMFETFQKRECFMPPVYVTWMWVTRRTSDRMVRYDDYY